MQSNRIRIALLQVTPLLLAAAALLAVGCSYPNHRRSVATDVNYSRPQPRVVGTYEFDPEPGYQEAYADDGTHPGMVIETAPYDGVTTDPAIYDDGPDGVAARAAAAEAEAELDWQSNPDPFALPAPDDSSSVTRTDRPLGPPIADPERVENPRPVDPVAPDDAVTTDPLPLPEPMPIPEPMPEPEPNARTLTQDDLMQMHEAGLSDATILAIIKACHVDFDVTPAVVIAMGRAGLSDVVIQAVIERATAQDADSGR